MVKQEKQTTSKNLGRKELRKGFDHLKQRMKVRKRCVYIYIYIYNYISIYNYI